MWEEETEAPTFRVPDDIQDVVFRVKGNQLPVDYALHLFQSLSRSLPWMDGDENVGVHLVTVAEEGNGWYRDDGSEQTIYLPKRSRLVLRVKKQNVADAMAIVGQTIELSGYQIEITQGEAKQLSTITTLYARNVVSTQQDETEFLADLQQSLKSLDVRCRKILCGKTRSITTDEGQVTTRSVMLAELTVEHAVKIQQEGIGPFRFLGCGFFVPHKSITNVEPR